MFVALEFDHALFQPQIRWIVVECAGLARKCGGPIALSPRHDVAYFVNPRTAEEDAHSFAEFKNRYRDGSTDENLAAVVDAATERQAPHRHFAYHWDHQLMVHQPLRWAVLEWSGDNEQDGPRVDAAYFVDPTTAELDAHVFAILRDQRTHSAPRTNAPTMAAGATATSSAASSP